MEHGKSVSEVKAADNSSPVVGTWRITDISTLTLATNEISRPAGENPIGYIQHSPGMHMVAFLSEANPLKPASFPFTDAERARIHKGIFGAFAGTYSVEGNKVTHHIVASWRPDFIGDNQIRYIEINANKLTIKTASLLASLAGKRIVLTFTFERAE